MSAVTRRLRRCDVHASTRAGVAGTDAPALNAWAPRPSNTTAWTSKASLGGSTTRLAPAAIVIGEQAVNGMGRPVSRSAKVPDTRVDATFPLSLISGPKPHGNRNGPGGVTSGCTPGITTSVI